MVHIKEDIVEDVENNFDDILVPPYKKSKKIIGGKNILTNVPTTTLYNVSFNSEESVFKWKFVYHRRIVRKR